MTPRDKALDDLVARIDAAQPIDWAHELSQATDEDDRHLVRGLKTLSEVAAFIRDPQVTVDPAPAPVGTPWGGLTVFEAVGRGAFGTVHRATDSVRRTVALKLLDPGRDVAALRARILAEGELQARIRHPNVVIVHGAGESDGRVGLWMEFIDGTTLAGDVAATGPLSGEEAAAIGRKLCGALAAIHGEGLVHGDVKAQNVMRERGGRIVLMDFGAAQALADADPQRLGGTPLYLSPERLAGAVPTPASDIYALGVLLYFLVTGAYPFDGDTREDVERAHREGRRTRLRDRRPGLPDAFVEAVETALAPAPEHRHETAGAFDAALARVSSAPRATGWLLPALGLGGAAAAAAFAGILWFGPRGDPGRAAAPLPLVSTVAPSAANVIQATFFAVSDQGRQPKVGGARVAVGDALELDLKLTRDSSVYVVNEDEEGLATLLFPLEDGDLRNPLPAGRTLTLPGSRNRKPAQWEVDSVGGREHFYVIVGPEADPDLQAAIQRLVPASDAGSSLRGTSKLTSRYVPRGEDAPWRTLARPLNAIEERAEGLWVRRLTLENPKPAPAPDRR